MWREPVREPMSPFRLSIPEASQSPTVLLRRQAEGPNDVQPEPLLVIRTSARTQRTFRALEEIGTKSLYFENNT